MKYGAELSFRSTQRFILSIALALCLIQCVNPQITSEGIMFWRDIRSLGDRHLGRFSYGVDRFLTTRIDTLLQPNEDFTLAGRDIEGSVWGSQNGGCLRIRPGVTVKLGKFRFIGQTQADTLIIVDGGMLELDKCDLRGPAGAGIIVRKNGRLIIRNSEIKNLSNAIYLQNSELELSQCNIASVNGDAITLNGSGTQIIEGLSISDIDGTGISVSDANAVDFKKISIKRVSQVGIVIVRSTDVRADSIKIAEIGASGIVLSNCETIQFSNLSVENCQQSGIRTTACQSLKMVQVSTGYNHRNGIEIIQYDSLMMNGVNSRKNDAAGIVLDSGSNFEISQSNASENRTDGLKVTDAISGRIEFSQFRLNENENVTAGIEIVRMDSIIVSGSYFGLNLNKGLNVRDTRMAIISDNDFQKNGNLGVELSQINFSRFTQNRFTENPTGAKISGVDSLIQLQNRYEKNQNGLVSTSSNIYSDLNQFILQGANGIQLVNSKITSSGDEVLRNATGVTGESSDVVWAGGNFGENDLGFTLWNSTLNLQNITFNGGARSVVVDQSPFVTIQNCQFAFQSDWAISISRSQELRLTNNEVRDLPNGLDLTHVKHVEFTHNDLERISATAVKWDKIESGSMAYNLFIENGTAIKLNINIIKTSIENNSFVDNQSCFVAGPQATISVAYNIFQNNASISEADLSNPQNGGWSNWTYNCFWKNGQVPAGLFDLNAGNFIADPVFHGGHYLKTGSPCLTVGPGQRLVGARGLSPALKPITD